MRTRMFEPAPKGSRAAIALSLAPGLLLFVAVFVVPVGMLIVTAFTDWSVRGAEFVGVSNFVDFLSDPSFWNAGRNTFFYIGAAVVIQIPLATMIALMLARRIRGWKAIRALLFLPNMISGAAIGLVYVFVFNPRFGLLNAVLRAVGLEEWTRDWLFNVDTAIWAVTATWVFAVGLYVILILAEIQSLPIEIHEAAQLDGASPAQRAWRITLPLIRPVLGTCVLLAVLFTLNFFDSVYVMTGGGPADATTTLSLFGYQAYSEGEWGRASAVGMFILLVGASLILVIRRLGRLEQSDR